jgi:hypothetical protein
MLSARGAHRESESFPPVVQRSDPRMAEFSRRRLVSLLCRRYLPTLGQRERSCAETGTDIMILFSRAMEVVGGRRIQPTLRSECA